MKKAPAKMKKKSAMTMKKKSAMTMKKKSPSKFTAELKKASAEGKLKGNFKKAVDASSKGETPAMLKKSALRMKKESMAMMKKSVAMMKKASAMQMKMKKKK